MGDGSARDAGLARVSGFWGFYGHPNVEVTDMKAIVVFVGSFRTRYARMFCCGGGPVGRS